MAGNYLKVAFLNVYNLSLVGGAAAASVLSGDHVLGAMALGAEALWLLFGPDLKPFQRAVDRQEREQREKVERKRMGELMDALPKRDWARAHALEDLRGEITRDMQHNPSFQAILIQPELDKLQQLNTSFITLATACSRAETYLAATDMHDLQRQVDIQKGLCDSMKDPAVQDIARKNVQVLERRIKTIADIQNFLARARGQMNLIENSVRLLRDQALTMASPDQLGEQLDDLLLGVDAIQTSAREQEALMSGLHLEPISPLPAGQDDVDPRPRGRVRS